MTDAVERVLAYHERTKHHPQRYARALGYLDWATQPDPFRTYAGAPCVELPLLADGLATPFAQLYQPGTVPAKPASGDTVAVLFELALGLSAWKQHQRARWALRCNPSSGNLHPTEGYAIVPDLPGLPAGVYHYVSRDHCLERRCDRAAPLPAGTWLLGLSSIHWREAWKYGERAFRYCQHDVGHAIAAVRYAAAALGWSAVLLDHLGDDAVAAALGLGHPGTPSLAAHDREHPDAMLLVGTRPGPATLADLPGQCPAWQGQANRLSPRHVDWEVISEVAAATWKPATPRTAPAACRVGPASASHAPGLARTVIRQRRSALALDGRTTISAAGFFGMLDRLLPRPDVPPWDALPWPPHLHLGIFVHRVVGLTPGLYLLERTPAIHERLRAALRPDFAWQTVPGCPESLRLFLLAPGDFRQHAAQISCQQAIAADGAFSLGMLADYGVSLRRRGAWWYRRLFWEAGMIGQVLYLEAEAAGVRGTGIGCYFDDLFHELLGLHGDDFQDLYHFTVGGPVDDPRLTTLPAYAHLQRS